MFWLGYLLVALLGSIAIYFAAPAVSGNLSDGQPANAPQAETAMPKYVPFVTKEPIKERPPKPAPKEEAPAAVAATVETSSGDGAVPPPPHGVADSQARDPRADSPEETPQEAEERPAYSLETIPQSSGEVIRWAIVVKDSNAYSPDGKKIPGKAPGGTLAEITQAVVSKKKIEFAESRFWDAEKKKWHGPFLVATADLIMFEGTRENLLASDLDNLLKYYEANGILCGRKLALDQALVDANPHAEKLKNLSREYNEKAKLVEELTAKRDQARNAERIKYSDELRRLESEHTRLSSALSRQVELFNKWKENHSSDKADYDSDGKYRRAKAKMKELFPLVKDFGVMEE